MNLPTGIFFALGFGATMFMTPASAVPLVSAREDFSMVALDGGWLWGTGSGSFYRKGRASSALMAGRSWKVLNGSLGIDNDGALWSWTSADFAVETSFVPVQIGTDRDWRSISSQSGYSFAVKNDGTMWGWETIMSPTRRCFTPKCRCGSVTITTGTS